MYKYYVADVGLLTDGFGVDDMVEVVLWLTPAGSGKKITTKIAGYACSIEIVQYLFVKNLISDRNSPYGKYLYENLKKNNHSKSPVRRSL